MSPIARHRASKVLAAALRKQAFNFENAISIDGVDGSCSRRHIAP
jgi:hypothetical protein